MAFVCFAQQIDIRSVDNLVWRGNLQKTEDAYLEWLIRCQTRFEAKCREVMDKKQQPNLRNNASVYREENHEMTFRACCTISNNKAALKEIFPSEAVFQSKLSDFRRGALDSDIMPSVKLLIKTFTLADFRFISLAGVMETVVAEPVSQLDAAQAAKAAADFNLFFERLRFEQAAFRRYLVSHKAYNMEAHAVQTACAPPMKASKRDKQANATNKETHKRTNSHANQVPGKVA